MLLSPRTKAAHEALSAALLPLMWRQQAALALLRLPKDAGWRRMLDGPLPSAWPCQAVWALRCVRLRTCVCSMMQRDGRTAQDVVLPALLRQLKRPHLGVAEVAWPEDAARCTKHCRDLCVNAATPPAASWSIITYQTHPSQRGRQHADVVAHSTWCVQVGAVRYNLGAAWSANTDTGSDAVHEQLLTAGKFDADTTACSAAGHWLLADVA